jgi:RNA-directed DNA polymerase
VTQGDLLADRDGVHAAARCRRAGPTGVRASIVAKNSRNGEGAKGTQEGGDVTDQTTEQQPTAVSEATKQVGEIRARWAWVEPAVWTERMLTALEVGVKGGKWFSLMDKVYARANLRVAFAKVKANGGAAGVDQVTVEMFERHLEENLNRLAQTLRDGTGQAAMCV